MSDGNGFGVPRRPLVRLAAKVGCAAHGDRSVQTPAGRQASADIRSIASVTARESEPLAAIEWD